MSFRISLNLVNLCITASICGGMYARVYYILYCVYDVVVKKVHVRYLMSFLSCQLLDLQWTSGHTEKRVACNQLASISGNFYGLYLRWEFLKLCRKFRRNNDSHIYVLLFVTFIVINIILLFLVYLVLFYVFLGQIHDILSIGKQGIVVNQKVNLSKNSQHVINSTFTIWRYKCSIYQLL